MLGGMYYYFWLYCIIRKKSQRVRIIKAARVFQLLKNAQFKAEPGRLFAYIRMIDPFVFEELLLLAFKSRGLKVIHNKRYTGDGGIDGIVILPNQGRIAIQAKRYQHHINVQHLKDFAQTVKNHRCHGGFFIHCGKSGRAVYQNMPDNMMLISGTNLYRLLVE
ncbi:MAG: restriction endonuclease [Legionella sp.]|nr:restriction endonuclease [Legionella sp.]